MRSIACGWGCSSEFTQLASHQSFLDCGPGSVGLVFLSLPKPIRARIGVHLGQDPDLRQAMEASTRRWRNSPSTITQTASANSLTRPRYTHRQRITIARQKTNTLKHGRPHWRIYTPSKSHPPILQYGPACTTNGNENRKTTQVEKNNSTFDAQSLVIVQQ